MKHEAIQIGDRDAEGYRTFATPGDVCSECSSPDTGLWVPVSFCPAALANYYDVTPWADRDFDEHADRAFRHMRAYRLAA